MATTYLTRTFGTATNRKIWTWSAWVKRQNLVSDHTNAMFGAYTDGSNRSVIRFHAHVLEFQDSGNSVQIRTNRLFRDTNAWYHILARVDTTQGTASDRVRLYVNGEQETSFSQADYPNQNVNMEFQNSVVHYINARHSGSAVDSIADMSYSHVHFADGQSLAPTVFGSTDSSTGEWKINTSPSFTLGTNGFTILKDGNTVTDQSSNSNDFSIGSGTLTKTEDCPSNVFATLNPLSTFPVTGTSGYFSNGNTVYDAPEGSPYDIACGSTLGVKGGKWYWEVKWNIDGGGTSQALGLGIYEAEQPIALFGTMRSASGYKNVIWDTRHDLYVNGSDTGTNYTGASGDTFGFALDLDAGTLKIHQNGTYYNSGNAVTSAIDVSKTYLILASPNGGSGNHSTARFNFGNGYFGTTAVSSAGTNASNNGIFEYDVPTGYTALSTKGLNL